MVVEEEDSDEKWDVTQGANMVEKVFIHVDEEIFAKRNFAVRDILGI